MTFFGKYSLVIVLITTSTGIFSTTAVAEIDKNIIAPTISDLINGKIRVAYDAINANSTCEKVAFLIKEALDTCKEIGAPDPDLDGKERKRACWKLKSAKKHAKECHLIDTQKELTQAEKMFEVLKIRDLESKQK